MLFRWAGFQRMAIWLSLMDGGTAPTPLPPPSTGSFLLMESGSFFLLEDGTSRILLEV